MRRIHTTSGIIISLFIVLHLANHAVSIIGAAQHIQFMNTLRTSYRNPFIEFILLAAIAVQIVSGIKLFIARRKNVQSTFDKLHLWSGLYLALFFIIHLSAVFIGRLALDLDTNFYFGVAGINSFPANLFFIPYYALAMLSFFAHLAAIHQKKMKKHVLGTTPVTQAKGILVVGIVLTFVIFYGLTNHFKGVTIPVEYRLFSPQ